MGLPATQKALVVLEPGKVGVTNTKPLPSLESEPDAVLVLVHAVSINPTDWKHVERLLKPGQSVGCDFAGVVVALGAKAEGKGVKVGDAVAGFVRGGFVDPDNGAFQEYVRQYPELLWKKPQSLSFEDAAPMGGIVLSTAAQGLYDRLGLPKPWDTSATPIQTPILIWAGSTGVGLYAIKLAKLSGLRVATTGSPRNHDVLKSIGADVVFDYNDSETPAKLKEWAAQYGGFRHAYDCISEYGSTKKIAAAFTEHGGHIIRILTIKEEVDGLPDNIKTEPILIYSVLKKKNEKDFADHVEWYKHLPDLIASGKLTPVPRKHWEGGLEALPEGLEYLKSGKASAQKITFTVSEATSHL
ncbi:GroES-like protein [Exidia glandulosa HHB12029]|uniref:GroES-like protein n=1 Tax=Exidia glandulosa HHB12029 TaxID=1314781 RepID=A0A165MET1_EXIGL|nr:GroES-like protein [Exidia glandulosa HHB12029]